VSKDPTGALDQLRAALREAEAASSPEECRRALAAIVGVQADIERRTRSSLGAEVAARLERHNWSDARIRHIEGLLAAAREDLEEQLT
jgi:hypothetical protein